MRNIMLAGGGLAALMATDLLRIRDGVEVIGGDQLPREPKAAPEPPPAPTHTRQLRRQAERRALKVRR